MTQRVNNDDLNCLERDGTLTRCSCGVEFQPRGDGGRKQKHCSTRCRNRAAAGLKATRLAVERMVRPDKRCAHCGKMFPATGPQGERQKFCTRRCHSAAGTVAWRKGHPERLREWERARRAKEPGPGRLQPDPNKNTEYCPAQLRTAIKPLPCTYCGKSGPSSVDKLIPDLGYTAKNCVPACMDCNRRKWNSTADQLIAMGERVRALLAERET